MPRKLERFPSATTSRYPWAELLDGHPWQLFSGEDFVSKPTTLIANARAQAKRRGRDRPHEATPERRSVVGRDPVHGSR
jgi:hypothetical protein